MIRATVYRYSRTLRRSPVDTVSMLLRPLLSATLFALFATAYLPTEHGTGFMIVSVGIVNLFTNAIQGAAYEAREESQGLRLDVIRTAPGGLTLFAYSHALLQTLVATLESTLLLTTSLLLTHYPPVHRPLYLALGLALLLATSLTCAAIGVHVTIRRHSFLAVSFTSVLLVTFAGAFYPVNALPHWAATVAAVNPLSYLVDIVRASLFATTPLLPPPLEAGICAGLLGVLTVTAALTSHRPLDTSHTAQP